MMYMMQGISLLQLDYVFFQLLKVCIAISFHGQRKQEVQAAHEPARQCRERRALLFNFLRSSVLTCSAKTVKMATIVSQQWTKTVYAGMDEKPNTSQPFQMIILEYPVGIDTGQR